MLKLTYWPADNEGVRRRASGLIAIMLAHLLTVHAPAAAQGPPACPREAPTVRAIVLDPTAPSTIYIGTDDGLALSDDGGRTWTSRPITPQDHVSALALDPRDPSTLWAGTGHDLRRTRDRGVTWTIMTMPPYKLPLSLRLFARLFHFYSEALEEGAAVAAAGKYEFNSVIIVPSPEPVVLAGAIGVMRTTDDGGTWHRMTVLGQNNKRIDRIVPPRIDQLVSDPHDVRTSWAVTDSGVLMSRDAGATWHQLEKSSNVTSLAPDASAVDTVYAGTWNAGIGRSVDGGRTWERIDNDLASAFIRLVALPSPAALYAVVQDRGLFKSTDRGRSWTQSLPADWNAPFPITADPNDPTTVYAGMYHGLRKTTDDGAHWFPVCPFARRTPDVTSD